MQETLSDPEEGTRKAPSDLEEETREEPLDPVESKREAPSDSEEETREAPSNPEKETKDAVGSTDSGGSAIRALRKLTISGIFQPIMSSRTRSRRVHTGVEGAALQSFLTTTKKGDEEGDEKST